jgi:hypothetical protein
MLPSNTPLFLFDRPLSTLLKSLLRMHGICPPGPVLIMYKCKEEQMKGEKSPIIIFIAELSPSSVNSAF